ncbi:MAG: hypothetical protein ABL963_05735 [Longimicrobiales bacterium]
MITRARRTQRWVLALVAFAGVASPIAGSAQIAPTPQEVPAVLPPLPISPRGAFIRAMILPGWGHATIGSYTRGAFYFGLESLTAYTLLRTRTRLGDARERAATREMFLRAGLSASGITDPVAIATELEQDEVLQGFEALVASRENQQEDLVAFGIFLIFLTGADAFVSAHLARFPDPIDVQAAPGPDGGMEVSVRVPLPR